MIKFRLPRPLGPLTLLLLCLPALAALWVWLSPLSFVPVPWPDDSAFYFVARELFRWPPRWVMLPQAPFEPTYRIWNFNTMPLYPFLIGLGRFIGIDGSWALKIWPLGFWAASGVALTWTLLEAGLPLLLTFAVTLAISMDPTLRWASVLIRPESLIGFFGMLLVLGLSLDKFKDKYAWWRDPVAWLLALAAYAHFNAIHLVVPVLVAYAFRPRRILSIGLHTTALLVPWFLTVAWHFGLFRYQMDTQWGRLAVPNDWLNSVHSALQGMFQGMGSPSGWPSYLYLTSYWLWAMVLLAAVWGVTEIIRSVQKGIAWEGRVENSVRIAPAAAWVLSAFWLWNSKPEVWFTYYLHEAIWCFAGLAILLTWRESAQSKKKPKNASGPFVRTAAYTLGAWTLGCALIFLCANFEQMESLAATRTWHWSAYHEYIDCIDRQLVLAEISRDARTDGTGSGPFRVWDPTFPDVTIELSRRHPQWELTRTNDFYTRQQLALRHGEEVDAVVVPETLNEPERWIDAPMAEHPEIQSLWMTWKGYFLYHLLEDPHWKPRRHLCQVGRWQAFIYLK
jgi:hypothetical protein